MQKRVGFIVLLFLLCLVTEAQQKLNYAEVEKTSYELYSQGHWKKLIQYAGEARQQGIDFFYLQTRTGIAYYNLKKYRKASEWFLKAWENDQSFDWLQEYVYYSLLFGGRVHEAYKLADKFSPVIKEKIGYSAKKLTGAGLEAGYSFNPDYDDLKATPHGQQAEVGENYGEAFYLKDYHFESLDLSHRCAAAISINHNLTYFGINREQHVDWGGKNIFSSKTNQFQYFVSPTLVVGKKWIVAPSLSLIWGDFSYASGGVSGPNRFFGNATIYNRDLVFSVSAWTHHGIFSPGVEYNYGNISNTGFRQYSMWLTAYPFSNLSLYFTPRIYFKSDEENGLGYNAFGISGGMQVGPVHFYGYYLKGDMENFIESAGYVISNFPGTSNHKISGSLYFPTGKKYRFVLRFISQDITESYQVYANRVRIKTVDYSYEKNTFTAGISWNF